MVIYSHSRLSTFEQCPLKFKFRYIDKLEPEIKQSIEGFLGNRVHDTLEFIYNESCRGRIVELDEIIEFYIQIWNREYTPEIKVVNEELDAEHYFEKGIKFLIDYFTENYPFKDNTIAVEKLIMLDLDPTKPGKYRIQGYIDRLVHDKDSNIFEIHDYKTGQIKTQEELDKDRQLALYSIGIREEFPEVQDVHLIWHFLDFNRKMSSKRTDEELNELKQNIINLIIKIESTKEFNANPSILCRWCEFRGYCEDKCE
jgi:putative RecB family exonuclease